MTAPRRATRPVIRRMAEKAANSPELLKAFRSIMVSAFEESLRDQFAGEEMRVYVPKIPKETRVARDARIEAALAAGEPQMSIAARERVSERHVRRIKQRLSTGQITP